jgi:hypothetical protein
VTETRSAYCEQIRDKLAELEPKVGRVKTRADEADPERCEEFNELFEILRNKMERVEGLLKELEGASEDEWRALKSQLDGALADLNNSLGNVMSRIS